MSDISADVAIIGAGPGATTCGAFLKKYRPDLKVSLFERERFPRDHVGESQLPMIGNVLNELGVWDRVEACNFPVKIGATYRWGNSNDLWDFNFLPYGRFQDEPRPSKYEGQRTKTAFQVDRAVYDKVLSDFAQETGCEISFGTAVREVVRQSDRVEALVLDDGRKVTAKYYVDASGHAGLLRRSLGIEFEEPSQLRNIAIWDYWRNADWAVSLGIGGTRIQILSLGYGWIWFIPIGPDRTSIGFVCPADYYKNSYLKPDQLYAKALSEEARLQALIANAQPENRLTTTKDWSFVAGRMSGENWFLVGEAMGFADPILSAGLSLTHAAARELAFLILESERGGDLEWMKSEYGERNDRRIRQHIRFADYWYTTNAHFSDLKEYTAGIARDAGLDMDADQAFQWLGTGGFIEEDMGVAGLALFRMDQVHQIGQRLSAAGPVSALHGYNVFTLKLDGARETQRAVFVDGGVQSVRVLKRGGKLLPLSGLFGWLVRGLRHHVQFRPMMEYLQKAMAEQGLQCDNLVEARLAECLEAMVRDGWVSRKYSPALPPISHEIPRETGGIRDHVEGE